MLKAIFFDLGDTLIDLGEGGSPYHTVLQQRAGRVYDVLKAKQLEVGSRHAFCGELAEHTEAFYDAALRQERGISIIPLLNSFLVSRSLPVGPDLLAEVVDAYCQTPGGSPLRAGALGLLSQLQDRGLRMGVISNATLPGPYMDVRLAASGLLGFFQSRVYSSDQGVAKPHPQIFHTALTAIGVHAAEAVHVGDRIDADVQGAQRVGMRSVLITVPGRSESPGQGVPDACIEELPQLPPALDHLFGL